MNDDELTMALREQRGRVAMTTPVEQIISRGRAVRARRRIPTVAATVGAATAVAVGVAPTAGHLAASPPAGSHPASSPGLQLAAWTVTRRADGSIQVTIRQAYDPVGLQRALRAAASRPASPSARRRTRHAGPTPSPGVRSLPPRSTRWHPSTSASLRKT
jgi:hypothetical protein